MTTPPDSQSLAALLAALPPALIEALETQDVQAFDLALRKLPPEQAQDVLRALAAAGIVSQRSQDELDAEMRAAYGATGDPD